MSKKIGLGIVTYKRPDYFKTCFESVPKDKIDELVVVNDGTPYDYPIDAHVIQHKTNKGVGISKNDLFRYLLDKGCDYIFLMEDDIIIKDPSVFEKYIEAHKETGIHHFNYSQHGLMNKYPQSEAPNPKTIIEYKNNKIALYPHCVGAFCFYTRECLEKVGLMDEEFYNASEHLEHTYRIIQNKMHPYFWWFADLEDSNKYLKDFPWSIQNSTISSNSKHYDSVKKSYEIFYKKHGIQLLNIPQVNIDTVKQNLKEIYTNK